MSRLEQDKHEQSPLFLKTNYFRVANLQGGAVSVAQLKSLPRYQYSTKNCVAPLHKAENHHTEQFWAAVSTNNEARDYGMLVLCC